MSAVLRPSTPPDEPPLRAKSLGKIRDPHRYAARKSGVIALYKAARGVSDAKLGERFARRQDDGAEIRTGAVVLTPHETMRLLPYDVAADVFQDAWRERIVAELADEGCHEVRALRLRLALTHLDALRVLKVG